MGNNRWLLGQLRIYLRFLTDGSHDSYRHPSFLLPKGEINSRTIRLHITSRTKPVLSSSVMASKLISRHIGWASRVSRPATKCPNHSSRPFSATVSRKSNTLMETSGFSETQLEVRRAIAKICEKFPEASRSWQPWHPNYSLTMSCRNIGLSATRQEHILANYMLHLQRTDGLGSRYPPILVVEDLGFRKLP
jgi:hypothetical protein